MSAGIGDRAAEIVPPTRSAPAGVLLECPRGGCAAATRRRRRRAGPTPPAWQRLMVRMGTVVLGVRGVHRVDWPLHATEPDIVVLADIEGNRFRVVEASRG